MFQIDYFFIDRFWIKSYPFFFKCLKYSQECFEEFKVRRDEFSTWTSNCFKFYRTLKFIQLAIKKGISIDKIVNGEVSPERVLRYVGDVGFYDVEPVNHDYWISHLVPVDYVCNVNGINVTMDMINGVRLIEWSTEYGVEKWIYIPVINDVVRLLIKPYYSRFRPPMIRLLVNACRYAIKRLEFEGRIKKEFYERSEYVHGNWFIPEVINDGLIERFYAYNKYIFEFNWSKLLRKLWKYIFGYNDDIVWKITQIEITFDGFFDKLQLLDVFRLLPGKDKTFKYSIDKRDEIVWSSDECAKYYVTLKKGLQVKTYSKAKLFDGRLLNRLEVTLSTKLINDNPGRVRIEDVKNYVNDKVLNEINKLLALCNDDLRNRVLTIIDKFIPTGMNKELAREFLVNIFIFGVVRGNKRWKDIAYHFKKKGIIEVQGRGKASSYRLRPEYQFISNEIRRIFREAGYVLKIE